MLHILSTQVTRCDGYILVVIWCYTLYRDQYRLVWSVIAVFFALMIVAMVLQFQCFWRTYIICFALPFVQLRHQWFLVWCRPVLFHLPAKFVCFADVYRIGKLLEMLVKDVSDLLYSVLLFHCNACLNCLILSYMYLLMCLV